MQLGKNIKIFINYFLGPLLFIWLSFSIYQQINNQPHLQTSWLHIKQSFYSYKVWYLITAVILIFVNWGIEAWKWKLSVASIHAITFFQAYKAILAGVSFSVTTPNRVGEYLGRMMYLPEGNRLKSISVTLVGSLSQLLVTFISGMISFLLLEHQLLKAGIITSVFYQFILFGCLAAVITLTLIYFETGKLGKLLSKWFKNSPYVYLITALREFDMQLLLKLLLLSFLRYLVFVTQYILLFTFFEVYTPLLATWGVMSIVFLAMAVIPSITLIEVGLRGEISLKLMGIFTVNSLGVGLTSVSIWFLNLVIPSIAGSILILGIKVFKRKNEAI